MRIIGLTGGIACGKSNISDWLTSQGIPVLDGDRMSRELTDSNGAALPQLRKHFGNSIFKPDGTLDRKALGSIVFSQPEELAQLNSIMQPLLLEMILARLDDLRRSGCPLCVLDMPLLFEKDLDKLCDSVWCTVLPADEQLRRLMARDGLSPEAASLRIASQMPVAEKARRSNVQIDTSGSIEETRALLPALLTVEQNACERSKP